MRMKSSTLVFCVLLGAAASAPGAEAASQRSSTASARPASHAPHRPAVQRRHVVRVAYNAPRRTSAGGWGGISCVPYARAVTGMAITGNGGEWWHNAAGLYARDQRPEPGSVMAFRSAGGMSRGHVAVVRQVIGPREVLIDHANWAGPGIRRGTVMHNVAVVDVSERNDWTAVKVQVGHDSSVFGRTYATYGFIHNRPDAEGGAVFAGLPMRRGIRFEQVAEAPAPLPVVLRSDAPNAPGARRR
ncbi:CHAP domain-containing protein [Siccirubricoccus sp. KC 17139]|uniref:CHAP domain-containing protein n=1 Tax=Siccirubricoccus soli TaxID=2899147 RepID=A0ABT1D2Z6_9PROT|nr:CHAP domain-containing protein [Siccirubricoccus soli]MCO6416308.1 CHAP domain-containing protein [Siccirubricoccus soli]MCP2682442.1 CHAP domain-containing protein [Siccirubricoccus soli]